MSPAILYRRRWDDGLSTRGKANKRLMIENTIEYEGGTTPPEEVKSIISESLQGAEAENESLTPNKVYAIVNQTDNAIYITLGYYLPDEAEIIHSDSKFTQEFRIRVTESQDAFKEQIMYHSVPVDNSERIGSDTKIVRIDQRLYKGFYDALRDDGLFEWEEPEKRILAD